MSQTRCPRCNGRIRTRDINVQEGVAVCRGCEAVTRLRELAEDADVSSADPASPPRGCRFSSDGVRTVVHASARSLGGALGLLFAAVFWNGIVSVFVLLAIAGTLHHALGSVPEWFPAPPMDSGVMPLGITIFLWVFLTPFIAIGALLAGTTLLAAGGRVEVRVDGERGSVFLGVGPLGWRRRFDVREVKSVTLGETTWKENDKSKPVAVID